MSFQWYNSTFTQIKLSCLDLVPALWFAGLPLNILKCIIVDVSRHNCGINWRSIWSMGLDMTKLILHSTWYMQKCILAITHFSRHILHVSQRFIQYLYELLYLDTILCKFSHMLLKYNRLLISVQWKYVLNTSVKKVWFHEYILVQLGCVLLALVWCLYRQIEKNTKIREEGTVTNTIEIWTVCSSIIL